LPSLLEADTPTSTSSLLGHTSLLTYLSISAQPEFNGRRQLTEFMLPDNVSVSLDRTKKSLLNEKVCLCTLHIVISSNNDSSNWQVSEVKELCSFTTIRECYCLRT